mgnify:CR=1 FL=1
MKFQTEKELLSFLESPEIRWKKLHLYRMMFVVSQKPDGSAEWWIRNPAFEYRIADVCYVMEDIRKFLGISGEVLDRLDDKDVRMIYNKCLKCRTGDVYVKLYHSTVINMSQELPESWMGQYKKLRKEAAGKRMYFESAVLEKNCLTVYFSDGTSRYAGYITDHPDGNMEIRLEKEEGEKNYVPVFKG